LKVTNPWFSGSADISTFSTEEVLATKLRALLQRNKGRDLVDLSHALELFPKLNTQRTADMFVEYMSPC
jgi:predicted nucleotidyltransferase component of viral defense system